MNSLYMFIIFIDNWIFDYDKNITYMYQTENIYNTLFHAI